MPYRHCCHQTQQTVYGSSTVVTHSSSSWRQWCYRICRTSQHRNQVCELTLCPVGGGGSNGKSSQSEGRILHLLYTMAMCLHLLHKCQIKGQNKAKTKFNVVWWGLFYLVMDCGITATWNVPTPSWMRDFQECSSFFIILSDKTIKLFRHTHSVTYCCNLATCNVNVHFKNSISCYARVETSRSTHQVACVGF